MSLQDPEITCENCKSSVPFSLYHDHAITCTSDDDCFEVPIPKVNRHFSPPTSPADAPSTASSGQQSFASTSTAMDEGNDNTHNLQKLVSLTKVSKEYCMMFLQGVHNGNLEEATDDFLHRDSLGIILSALGTKLTGPARIITISSDQDAFSAAFRYFKGCEYNATSPLTIRSGMAIDAGGPLRQFFEDVFQVILKGQCIKLFEGPQGRMAPVNSSATVMSGVLETIGRIIAHSLVQNGPTFPFLAPPIYWYIVTGSTDVAMQHCSVIDAVSAGVKFVLEKVCNIYISS